MKKEEGEAKRRKLINIEEDAMMEQDPEKLAGLFEKYRVEYMSNRTEEDTENKRRKTEGPTAMQENASGSNQPVVFEEMEIDLVKCIDPWEFLVKAASVRPGRTSVARWEKSASVRPG